MTNIIGSTDFRMQHFTIRELLSKIDADRLCLNRAIGKEWNESQCQNFVESVLCGIPIASIYLNGCRPQWDVIDGVERLLAIKMYVENLFPLRHLEILPKAYEGYFSDLPLPIRRRFLNTSVIGYVLTTQLPVDVMKVIFNRLNG